MSLSLRAMASIVEGSSHRCRYAQYQSVGRFLHALRLVEMTQFLNLMTLPSGGDFLMNKFVVILSEAKNPQRKIPCHSEQSEESPSNKEILRLASQQLMYDCHRQSWLLEDSLRSATRSGWHNIGNVLRMTGYWMLAQDDKKSRIGSPSGDVICDANHRNG